MTHDITVRSARLSDARDMNGYIKRTFAESRHLITRAEEFHIGPLRQRFWISRKISRRNELCLVAEAQGQIIAMLDNWTDNRARVRHTTTFAMSVAPQWQRQGIGKKLLSQFIEWVQKHPQLSRIELHVHSDNEAAIALYRSVGFRHEGTRLKAVQYEDGRVVDDHIMALWPWPQHQTP